MCLCGAPQSGSDITGLVSPGLCGAGCAVQGGEEAGCEEGALRWSVRRQRRSAPCAWHAAVVLPRISAQPRAEMMGGKLLGSAAQPGAGCVVQCTRSPATGAGCDGGESAADAVSAAPPWCSVVAWLWAAHRERRGEVCPVSSVSNCLRLRGFSTLYLTPRLPRG